MRELNNTELINANEVRELSYFAELMRMNLFFTFCGINAIDGLYFFNNKVYSDKFFPTQKVIVESNRNANEKDKYRSD